MGQTTDFKSDKIKCFGDGRSKFLVLPDTFMEVQKDNGLFMEDTTQKITDIMLMTLLLI